MRGGTTVHFLLSTIKDLLACKIFLDAKSLNTGLAVINNPSASSVSDAGMFVHQLRHIRTQFGSPTTYNFCRASGPLTKISRNGNNAKLAKAEQSSNRKMQTIMATNLDLFDDETDTLPMLYNTHLNTELEGLAELLITSIASANEGVEMQVTQVFEFLNVQLKFTRHGPIVFPTLVYPEDRKGKMSDHHTQLGLFQAVWTPFR
ncbi:hypothetical protein DFQ28_010446 [Apophysomyces sp. BC1034]|nr:hypothetical protein DFQ30_000403 [Apophysomyces sp. BC1015]KAG0171232.1 hypothetical protein DFQ29_008959 [Apophysomyces sp. BC1021]KAG0184804.1 hypothetical protein DFQ28_010446 [Apophysomyces sp. BC1034]